MTEVTWDWEGWAWGRGWAPRTCISLLSRTWRFEVGRTIGEIGNPSVAQSFGFDVPRNIPDISQVK